MADPLRPGTASYKAVRKKLDDERGSFPKGGCLSLYFDKFRQVLLFAAKPLAALHSQIPVTASLRVPPKGSEVGVRVQHGQHSSPRARNARLPVTFNLRSSKFLRLEIIHMNYDLKECGRRIRQLRIQHGYTQEGFARELKLFESS